MVLGLIVRGGALLGAIYYTRRLGVWGNTEETEKLYNHLKSEMLPYAQQVEKQLPFKLPAMPKTGEMRFLAKHYYNQGVKETFHFIHMLPCYSGQLLKKAKDGLDSFSQAPPPTAAVVHAAGESKKI